jgi:hypothetical protein
MTVAQIDLLELSRITGLSINDLIIKLGTVADLVEAHEGYQDKLPEEVPGPPRFRTLAQQLHQADQAAVNKDRAMLAKCKEIQLESIISLQLFGQFAIMRAVSRKDMSYLDNIGIDRKKPSTAIKRSGFQGPIGTPEVFTVKHGRNSGTLSFKIGSVKWAAHYDVYVCYGDPNDEASWKLAATFVNTRNTQITGLEPGKVPQFKVQCLGPEGLGPFSNIIKIMVL